MVLQMTNKRALIAGGTGRIGRAIAARLEAEGWQLLAAGRADGDLATAAGARALVATAVERLGGLDLVVQAASDGFVPKAVEEVTEADWDAAADVTGKGSFFLAQAAVPHLRESRGVLILVEDVAEAVSYLAGAGFMTGTTLVVDGGRLLQTGRHLPS
jgi:NAD(P)-dependent dehydrogenase (short-subunit alcohol dehydrogenase family)